jgi:hypothetical protein
MEENERVIANGGRPATGRPLLLGITKSRQWPVARGSMIVTAVVRIL